eukprot:6475107-Amphidinium_carterae.1
MAATKSFPGDSAEYLPTDVRNCIECLVRHTPSETMMHRLQQIVFIKSLVRECAQEQQNLEESMHPDVRRVMAGKQIVAIRRLLAMFDLSDPYFESGLETGFSLLGPVPPCGWEYGNRERPATLTVTQREGAASELRREVIKKTRPSGDPEVDSALWKATKVEIANGWLGEPMSITTAFETLGEFVPARRFAVVQKDKLRPIDDYSVSGANSTVQTVEKPWMQTLDGLVAQAKWLQRELVRTH